MGDTGAMLIGLLLAYAPISSLASLDPGSLTDYASSTAIQPVPARSCPCCCQAAIMLIPYADLLMAVIRRAAGGHVAVRARPQAPASPHARHRPLAPDQRPDHVSVGGAVRGQRGVAVDRPDPLFVLVIVTVGAMLALLFVSMPRLRPWARPLATPPEPATGRGRRAVRPRHRPPERTPLTPASATHARRHAATPADRPPPAGRACPHRPGRRTPARPAVRQPPAARRIPGLAARPAPPQAALQPAPLILHRAPVPGLGRPEGAQLASWPGGPRRACLAVAACAMQESSRRGRPRRGSPPRRGCSTPRSRSPPRPAAAAQSSPPWPGGLPGSSRRGRRAPVTPARRGVPRPRGPSRDGAQPASVIASPGSGAALRRAA